MTGESDEDGDLLIKILFNKDFTLKFVYLLQLVFSLLAISCLIIVLLQLCSTIKTFTHTITMLVLSLCSALITLNIGILLSSAYHLHLLILRPMKDWYSWMSFTSQDCFFIKTIPNIALFAVYTSSLTFAVERIVGSLMLQDTNSNTKRWMGAILVLLQWSGSVLAGFLLPIPSTERAHFAHCSTNILMPTQVRQFFYIILGTQCFALSIYSVLTYHHTTPLVLSELKRFNFSVYQNVVSTEQTLPLMASIVGLFVLNVVLDKNFVFTVWSLAGGLPYPNSSHIDMLAMSVRWAEYQTLLLPFMSLVVVAVLILRWSEKGVRHNAVQENVVNLFPELMQTIEDFYENQSEATSTCTSESTPVNSRLSCRRDVHSKLQELCKNPTDSSSSDSQKQVDAEVHQRKWEEKRATDEEGKKANVHRATSLVADERNDVTVADYEPSMK